MQTRRDPLWTAGIFVVNTFAISWLCWLPLAASDHGIGHIPASVGPLLVILGAFGPFLSAVALVSQTGGLRGLRNFLSQAFRWRAGIQWYAAALVAPFAIRLVVIWVHVLKGGRFPGFFDLHTWMWLPSTFLAVLLIGGPVGEEFGWRGFLLQRVQPAFGVIGASWTIGIIAALWHIPLFFITGTAQSHLPYLVFALRTISLSFVSTWLYNGTRRSLLFVLLFHASMNTWPNTLYLVETDGSLGPYISSTILYAGWACQLFLLGLLKGRGDRRQATAAEPGLAA